MNAACSMGIIVIESWIYTNISVTSISKMYPLFTKQWNETTKYRDILCSNAYLLIFNLNGHTLHFKIALRTPEKVTFLSALDIRGSVKGPSHDLVSQTCDKIISTLTFFFLSKRIVP